MNRFEVSRRGFVAAATAVSALAAAAPPAAAAATAAATPTPAGLEATVPFSFDRAAFAALLEQPYEHRQVVAIKSFANALDGLNLMRNSIEAYADPRYFAAGPKGFRVIAVLYHGSSPALVLDDAMFAKYPLASAIATYAGAASPGIDANARTNPAAARCAELVSAHDVAFLVCNNALSGLAAWIAEHIATPANPATRADVVAIHDELVAHFLPGAVLVPAGVAALNAAQEARFTFLPT